MAWRAVNSWIFLTGAKSCVYTLWWGERPLVTSCRFSVRSVTQKKVTTALSRRGCAFKFHYNYATKVAFILVIPLLIIQVDVKLYLIDKGGEHNCSWDSNLFLFLMIWMPDVYVFICHCSKCDMKKPQTFGVGIPVLLLCSRKWRGFCIKRCENLLHVHYDIVVIKSKLCLLTSGIGCIFYNLTHQNGMEQI